MFKYQMCYIQKLDVNGYNVNRMNVKTLEYSNRENVTKT